MRVLTSLVSVVVAVASATASVRADGSWLHELKLGIVANDVGGLWSGFHREAGVGIHGEVLLSPHVAIWGGVLRPAAGLTVGVSGGRTDQATSKAFAGARWIYDDARGWFFSMGLGAAIHDGQLSLGDPNRKALGARVLFHVPFEIGIRMAGNRSLSLYFDHISNGGTRPINEGVDNLGSGTDIDFELWGRDASSKFSRRHNRTFNWFSFGGCGTSIEAGIAALSGR